MRMEREVQMSQMEKDNERRQQLTLSLAAEEKRRQDTEDKLAALQHQHAKTEEEEAKLRLLEQQLVIDLALAKDEINSPSGGASAPPPPLANAIIG